LQLLWSIESGRGAMAGHKILCSARNAKLMRTAGIR
jgi:hypothetical protein